MSKKMINSTQIKQFNFCFVFPRFYSCLCVHMLSLHSDNIQAIQIILILKQNRKVKSFILKFAFFCCLFSST